MEKIKCICVMRELMMALYDFEDNLVDKCHVSLNEAMVLCALGNECVTATIISERTGLRPSHSSKVIGALEERGFLMRQLGKEDKRRMYLSLTDAGKSCLNQLKNHQFELPPILRPMFDAYTN